MIDEELMGENCFYNMNHLKRGLALIFNHESFDSHAPRRGTHVDRDRLNNTLKSLDFEVRIFENLKIEQIKHVLSDGKWEFITNKLSNESKALFHSKKNYIFQLLLKITVTVIV